MDLPSPSSSSASSSASSSTSSAHTAVPRADRTVEHLKQRFYSIQRTLLNCRNFPAEEVAKHPIIVHEYNAEAETHRREQLALVIARTRELDNELAMKNAALKQINADLRKLKGTGSLTNGPKGRPKKGREGEDDMQDLMDDHVDDEDYAGKGKKKRSRPTTDGGEAVAKRAKVVRKAADIKAEATGLVEGVEIDPLGLGITLSSPMAPIPAEFLDLELFPYLKDSGCYLLSEGLLSNPVQISEEQQQALQEELKLLKVFPKPIPNIPGVFIPVDPDDPTAANQPLIPLPNPHYKPSHQLFQRPSLDVCEMYNKLRTDIVTMDLLRKHTLEVILSFPSRLLFSVSFGILQVVVVRSFAMLFVTPCTFEQREALLLEKRHTLAANAIVVKPETISQP